MKSRFAPTALMLLALTTASFSQQQLKMVFFRQIDSLTSQVGASSSKLPDDIKMKYWKLCSKYDLSAKNMLSVQRIAYSMIGDQLLAPVFKGNLSEKMVVEKLIENADSLGVAPDTARKVNVAGLTSGKAIVLAFFEVLTEKEQKELRDAISDYKRRAAKKAP